MPANKKLKRYLIGATLAPVIAIAAISPAPKSQFYSTLGSDALAKQLGWVASNESNNKCGGYYLEEPLTFTTVNEKNDSLEITGNQGTFSQHGTSTLEGKVVATRTGQQLTANKAYLYRDPVTGKLSAVDLVGDVHLREPNTLVVGKQGRYDANTHAKSLIDILYRTVMNGKQVASTPKISEQELQTERRITSLTAWGRASEFSQTEPKVYELTQASFSTCPPTDVSWQVKASHIVINKNIGRGYATNARILVRDVPVFYSPYLNFSIDRQRKSGFLWPTIGGSNQWGPYVLAPFYWNMAPNYDMTITPGFLSKSGFQLIDRFRYLTPTSTGVLTLNVVPDDKNFAEFQKAAPGQVLNSTSATNPTTLAELNRLKNDSLTRKSLRWFDNSQYSDHWSSRVDFSYAGDDYFMRNFGNLNELSQNQLLQEADLFYKGPNWNFTGRMQAYQTLHPVNENDVSNQYRRFPQLILNGDYPDQPYGLEFFVNNEATNFTYINNPGWPSNQPTAVGTRLNVQPGVSLPMSWPWLYVNPRFQVAFTDYTMTQNTPNNTIQRGIPIFDVASGVTFDRSLTLFGQAFSQTLEPQLYYTYIPYRDQSTIPLFDTTSNTLTYDQIFNYNRFTGIDRIGDANQLGAGISTRFIDRETGLEKVKLGVGDIIYFANRFVTLCYNPAGCPKASDVHGNYQRFSPVSGLFNYNMNSQWGLGATSIWDPVTKQVSNSTVGLHYQPDGERIINLGFNYARGGDILSGVPSDDPSNNLKVSDVSFAWPAVQNISVVGRWSQNWNHVHLQNMLYGLQYDTCCWAVRVVGGKAFIGADPLNNNQFQYNNEFYIQISLKGLGDFGTGNPTTLLSTITGYQTPFGQE